MSNKSWMAEIHAANYMHVAAYHNMERITVIEAIVSNWRDKVMRITIREKKLEEQNQAETETDFIVDALTGERVRTGG